MFQNWRKWRFTQIKRHEAAEKGFELNIWAEKRQYVVAKGRKERQEEKKQKEGGAEPQTGRDFWAELKKYLGLKQKRFGLKKVFFGWTEKVFWAEAKMFWAGKMFWTEVKKGFGLKKIFLGW